MENLAIKQEHGMQQSSAKQGRGWLAHAVSTTGMQDLYFIHGSTLYGMCSIHSNALVSKAKQARHSAAVLSTL
jgi:hypothetical protein